MRRRDPDSLRRWKWACCVGCLFCGGATVYLMGTENLSGAVVYALFAGLFGGMGVGFWGMQDTAEEERDE